MAAGSREHAGEARAALRAIVSDPEHGASALDNPQTISNLLGDLLPDAPRESGLLVAAASAGLPRALLGHVAQGLDPATAITLAAALLAGRTAFTADACQWVAGELAIALGLARADQLVPPRGPQRPETASAAWTSQPAATAPLTLNNRSELGPGARSTARKARSASRRAKVLAAGAVITVATAIVAVLLVRSPGGHHPHRTPPRAATSTPAPHVSSPSAVVQAYLAAINQRDWRRVWNLGGKNLGQTYRQMIAGYRYTSKVVITAIKVRAGAVTVRVLAYETTGAVQTYQLSYLVSGGTIIAGQETLLRTSR